jgi:GNAT superfamily N-acetyltransferase
MRLVDIDAETEGTFFRCLHDEKPDNPRVTEIRRRWFDRHKDKGLRAKVLVLDTGEVVGLCQYLPIEHSPFLGRDLLAILCIWVHGYAHHVGNRQGQGYGRFILDAIEQDARSSNAKGVAAWGKDFPYWNPVSFYEHMGYARADQEGADVLVWKRFDPDAEPPKLMRPVRPLPQGVGKVKVTAFLSGWCGGGISYCFKARQAVEGLDQIADYEEIDTSDRQRRLEYGVGFDGVYLDGKPFRADGPPFSVDELKAEIRQLHEQKKTPPTPPPK